jgi:hypothetical protein
LRTGATPKKEKINLEKAVVTQNVIDAFDLGSYSKSNGPPPVDFGGRQGTKIASYFAGIESKLPDDSS